jgi:hypothetical protein
LLIGLSKHLYLHIELSETMKYEILYHEELNHNDIIVTYLLGNDETERYDIIPMPDQVEEMDRLELDGGDCRYETTRRDLDDSEMNEYIIEELKKLHDTAK